jgi:predicted Zn finger-like uncharacterized protein
MFKVVPDQIRIAAGWVRCGHCSEVFDASAYMLPYAQTARPVRTAPLPEAAPAQPPASGAEQSQAAPVAPASEAAPGAELADRTDHADLTDTEAQAPPDESLTEFLPTEVHDTRSPTEWPTLDPLPPANAALPDAAAAPMAREVPADPPAAELVGLPPPAVEMPAVSRNPAPEAAAQPAQDAGRLDAESPPPPITQPEPEPEPAPAQADLASPAADGDAPSFVTAARRRAFWSSRPMRALLGLSVLALLLALAAQIALARRDWLAAREPRLTPALNALCAPLGCQVQPWRQLDAIVIDSSAFNRVDARSFRFSVTLRNTSDLPVASPALELALTDAQDQALVRRVVTAAELGAPAALAARAEFNGVSVLTVQEAANPAAITGYRLTAFYP